MKKVRAYRFDASGCNGCDIEILSAVTDPRFGLGGVEVVDDPSVADVILVTGGENVKTAPELMRAVGKMPRHKTVVAVGTCAHSMCVFKGAYPMRGPIDAHHEVSLAIVGCPPRPQNIALALRDMMGERSRPGGDGWAPPERLRGKISLDEGKCTACGACMRSCPSGAIDVVLEGRHASVAFNMWKCSFCGTCEDVCPEEAVSLTGEYAMWHRDKRDAAVGGKMERDICASCGSPMHTAAHIKAIRERILKSEPGYGARSEVIEESLRICSACKAYVDVAGKRRRALAKWAYD